TALVRDERQVHREKRSLAASYAVERRCDARPGHGEEGIGRGGGDGGLGAGGEGPWPVNPRLRRLWRFHLGRTLPPGSSGGQRDSWANAMGFAPPAPETATIPPRASLTLLPSAWAACTRCGRPCLVTSGARTAGFSSGGTACGSPSRARTRGPTRG